MQTQMYKYIVTDKFWKTPYPFLNRLLWEEGRAMGGIFTVYLTHFCVV